MENTNAIDVVSIEDDLHCHCPLGDQWYDAHVEVDARFPNSIPDYMTLSRDLHSLDGESLSIEGLCGEVHERCVSAFSGKVTTRVSVGRGLHMPVTVTKGVDLG